MPIFEYNGKKYNVRDEHIDSFMKDFPDASTIMEREGKKYRVKSADYKTFMSEQQQPEQPAPDFTPETPATPMAGETPLTEQDKIRFNANIGQMKRRTEQMMDGFNEQMETMREYRENAPLGGGQTSEGKMKFNPESGKLEKTYITPLGNRYTSKGVADMEGFRYRQAADMSVSGQLRRARLKLAELQEKRSKRASEVLDETTEFNKTKLTGLGRALIGGQMYVGMQQGDKENSALDIAIRQTEELIKDLEEQNDREQGVDVGFWRGFGRVAGDVRTWDFGMGDMRDALTMMNADDLKGENATEGEREAYNEMMGALYNKEQAEQMYGGNVGFWNRAGMMTGHMPAFMLDFGITGGGFKGINVLSKAGTKAATKMVGKEAVEQMAEQGFKTYVKNNGVKGLGQYATNWTIKALGTTADDLLLRAPLMTNTVQAGKTTADIIDRKLGDVVVDENGNYDFSNDKTWGNAIWQGEANAIVENATEMGGNVLTLDRLSKFAGVFGAKRISEVLAKANAGTLGGMLGKTNEMFQKVGVGDYLGEVGEEYKGQLWRTMLNLDDAYQQNPDGTRTNLLATGQFHGDIWGGMALSMGAMGGVKTGCSAVQYAWMKHGVDKADARAGELLGKDVWEPLRATLDLTTNDNIGEVAGVIVQDKDFTAEEKSAVVDYMERSMNMRGFNMASTAQARSGMRNADDGYLDGYNAVSPRERTDIKNMYEYQRGRMKDELGVNDDALAEGAVDWMQEGRAALAGGTAEGRRRAGIIMDYLTAKQVRDGMMQRVRDDIDSRIAQSDASVDARVNRQSGMVEGAVMKVKDDKGNDRRAYIVSGNVVPYPDGTGIDRRASDGSVIVRDAVTGELEQVSADAIWRVEEQLNPDELKAEASRAIRESMARRAADDIDCVVTFNPGDTYTITGDDAQIQVQVVANEDGIVDNGDGTVNVSDGVNVFPLAKETIQQQADAANLARVAQFEQQRTIENAERKQEIQEADRPQYALNDIISLTDENGVTVRGNITADADADGRYEVFTEAPINGKRVNLLTRDELDNMLLEHNGVAFERPAENEGNNGMENIPENSNNAPQNIVSADLAIPAMQRIPKDEQGNPLYEQTDSDTAWDAIVEQADGDEEIAGEIAADFVAEHEKALKSAEKELKKVQEGKPEQKKGNAPLTMEERIAAKKAAKEQLGQAKANVDAAKEHLAVWKKIASTPLRRKQEAEAEQRRIADEAAALRKAEEEKLRAEREEAERIEREALNGVPDMVDDKPQDARARGYRRMNGHKIDRQEKLTDLFERELSLSAVNSVFNEELRRYREGAMDSNEMFHLGGPQGVMRMFLPDLPIVMRQRILNKGSVRKHNVAIEALADMPIHLSHPIFVFKRSDNALGVLTDMQDRDGKNICVAIELKRQIQDGGEILEVNDIRSVHGRNVADIVYPIVQNGTLEWVDKEKGLAYLSSASRYVQQEIDKQDLIDAAKVVENFENPKSPGGKVPEAILGKDVSVKFSDDVLVGGHAAVIDANRLQPSHIQGVRNPLHFIDEAQPKERNDEASLLSSRKIAGNIRPEEITSSVTAYTGAPTVNARGEVIQGNNRSDALRQMWEYYPGQADIYKQYLKDHAEQFGLQAEDIEGMEHPVLVNMVDVDDAEAINLGQFVAQDTESGGIERIKPKNIMQKMGNDMRSFANLLLASSDEEISFAGLVDANGTNVLKWMMQEGYITPTQYSSAFDSKGNLTAEAKNDLRGIMYQSIFKGGSVRLEEMFNALPVKAQKAILATAFRDYDSPNAERMVEEIQNSIRAYYALSQDRLFAEAKNFKEARIAVESWKRQYQIDDATGESYLPADNFSNFALLLATMYKGSSQGFMQGMFAEIYDLVQGTQEATLFEEPDNTPRTLTEAINEAVNKRNELLYGNEKFEYDGQRRSNVLAGGGAQGQREQQGSRGDAQAGERVEDGTGTAERGRGTERNGGQRTASETHSVPQKKEINILDPQTMSDEEKLRRGDMLRNAPAIDVKKDIIKSTPELSARKAAEEWWDAHVGEPALYDTEVGEVEINKNSIESSLAHRYGQKKLDAITSLVDGFENAVYLGTLPDSRERGVVDHYFAFPINYNGERHYVFCRAMQDANKNRLYVHEVFVADKIKKGDTLQTAASKPHGGISLYRDILANVLDVPVTTSSENSQELSDSKGTNNSVTSSELGEKIAAAEAETNTNPTDKQKEAGNYKKGHVQVGVFDITIEQPKGSVRSGVDAGGNKWETTMQNTYGYIRGTEGVDGDHIDVFLSDDIDGWNGRRVFVVDQYNEDGSFDEHKVMLGFNEADEAEAAYFANYDSDWAKKHKTVVTAVNLEDFEKWIDSSHRKTKAFAEYKGVNPLRTDHQGNPLNADGSLKVEKVGSVDELTDDDFLHPFRNVELPTLPEKVDAAIGVNGKPVVIKKNIFEKNRKSHKDLSPEQSRGILSDALYTPNMYGQNQKTKRPYNWILIHNAEKHSSVILEVSHLKDNIEIVNWHYLDDATLKQKEKQAVAEGGLILTLESAAGDTHNGLSSEDKGSKLSAENQEKVSESSRPYSITPAQYTTKRGKVLDMQLVTLRDALADRLRSTGIEVVTDSEVGQRVLDEANGYGAQIRLQARLSSLDKAAKAIHNWIARKAQGKVFTIELPEATRRMIRNVMGRDFDSHNITINGIRHGLDNHGVDGKKLNENSIPVREEDAELIPYIMTAPDYVRKGSEDVTGRESVRFYKTLSNGYVVVVEKEYKNSPDDMETITMWAEMSSEAINAQRRAVPDTHVQNAILSTDAAKIRKDAENAIRNEAKLRDHVRFFRTADGEAYGFTAGDKIYLDPKIATAETPVHEYAHLWSDALRRVNPEEWQNVVELMKDTPVWEEVKSLYPELETDSEIADEVLAHYSGRRGAERLREAQRKIADEKGDVFDKARAISAIEQVKEALKRFWKGVADWLHIHFTTAEEVADKVMADLLNGVNPMAVDAARIDKKELIAVHNLSEKKLKDALELGGFPMPSIAITKADVGHTNFGVISLVFDKESINPSDRRNKVYGEDAWTPTFPEVGYKLNDKKINDIYDRANKAGKMPIFNPVDFHPTNFERHIDGINTQSIVDHFKDDYGAKQLFLSEKGDAVKEFVQKEVQKYNEDDIALYKKILAEIGIERLRNESAERLADDIARIVGEHRNIDFDKLKPNVRRVKISNARRSAIDYAENGTTKIENDIDATKRLIDERVNEKAFEQWLDDLFDGVVVKKGIRNDKDWYTPSGSSRNWEALYDEITLDNVVRAMQRQSARGGEGLFGGSIFGAAQEEYKDIDAIREAAKNRIRTMDEAEYDAKRNAITDRLSAVNIQGAGDNFSEVMDMCQNIQDAVAHSHTPKGIHKYLKAFYPKVTMENAKEIADIVKDIQRMSARYFEAKPYRAVGFDEVKLAVVPSDTDANLVERLKQMGIEVKTYAKGDHAQRREIVDEATEKMRLRFQLVGEKGAANMDKAEEATVRLDNLSVAREMEKSDKDAKSIKLATGWERGADGKWRYEIMDGEFDRLGELHPERRKLNADEQKELNDAFDELMDAFEKGSLAYKGEIDEHTDMADIYEAGGMERKKAERLAYLENKESELEHRPKHLDDYLSNEELFLAYPQLRNIEVKEGEPNAGLFGNMGSFNPETNSIKLNLAAKDVLLHEVQHAIQHIEGFATGGSPSGIRQAKSNNRTVRRLMEKLLENLGIDEWLSSIKDNMLQQIEKHNVSGREFTTGYMFADSMDEINGNALRKKLDEANRVIFENNKIIGGEHNELTPEQHYHRLSGEVEARNAEKRMDMTEDERRNTLASETEDVAREDQIFIMNSMGGNLREGELAPGQEVSVVETSLEHGFKDFSDAKEWAKSNIARTYTSEETGGKGEIRISNTAIDKFLSESSVKKSENKDVHLSVLKVLPDVIRESVDAEQHADYKKGADGIRSKDNGINSDILVHRLYGAVATGDKVYRVKVTVKEDVRNGNLARKAYSYEATKIELLAGTLGKPNKGDAPNTNNSITVAKLLKGVEKSYSNGELLLPENENLRKSDDTMYRIREEAAPVNTGIYKTKKGSDQRVIDLERSLLLTSKTSLVHPLSDAKIPQMFENPSVSDENLRVGDGALTDDDLSMANDPVSMSVGKSTRTARQRRAFAERERRHMVVRVRELAEKLHLDNVDIVTDASTLQGDRAKAKGFFSRSTGRITVVIPNQRSVSDAEQTLLHEAVAHYGLRQLFGEHFDTFLDNVFNNADENIRRRIMDIRKQLYRQYAQNAIKGVTSVFEQAEIIAHLPKNESDFTHTATEEYLASLAENTEFENTNASWWREIKELFLRMLHKIGFEGFSGVTLSDNELRYILWRSYENLAEPGRYRSILGEAADVAKQAELKVGNYTSKPSPTDSEVAEAGELEVVNERFNEELAGLTEENADKVVLSLGRPSSILLSAGVTDKPMKLYGNKVMKKMRKHGFSLEELRDLPRAVANPIAVFENYGKEDNRSVLTELHTEQGNFLVTLSIGQGHDIDFNIVTSVFGKGKDNIIDWFNRGFATYVDKQKTLDYLHHSALKAVTSNNRERGKALNKLHFSGSSIPEASDNAELSRATKVVENFENPVISHENISEEDVLYRDGDPERHERELARDRYEQRVKSGMYQSQEALQDSMLGLKEAMSAILGKRTYIEDVDGFENAYLGENRLSSVNKAEADAFAHLLFKPMLDEVAKLARTEAEREELTDYMMAKHGLERNTYMRNEAINNGATDAGQTDYAGLTALTGMDNVADAEAEAQLMVDAYEQAHDTTALWKKVNAVSKAILSKSYECGMMSKATFDKVSSMYDFYIPLRGFDEKTSSEAYAYLTHKQSAFNAPIKKAEGRRSKADDPFANLQSMAEGAIMQGNRNKLVKQRFLNFALNHPSDLVSVSELWLEYDNVADEWKPVFPDNIDSTDTPEEVERKMQDFETKMESLAQQFPDRYKHGKDTVNIPYRIVESRDLRQHQIVVKRGGREYVITINGNPRAAQAVNGQTNPDNDMSGAIGEILRAGENINRQLSAFYTTRNPDFIVSNFIRDMLYTNTMVWIKESPNYALRFHRNYMYANPVKIKQLLAKHRKGMLDMSDKTEAMFHQFMMNGGETGYANIRDIEQHKNDIRRELKKSNGKIPVKKAWDLLGERFDEYNRAVENCARFAAFMTSREMGRSIDRAIYDAKEISVNFNKKGSGAKFYDSTGQTKVGNASALVSGLGRSGYVFWNAAIQGTTNFGRQMKRHPAKAFTGIAAMFLLGAIVACLGGDDDDEDDKNSYYNLPEHVRRSNILFRAGDSWVSIPLPVEYRAVYGMGELMISVLNGKEHLTGGEIAEAIAGQATQILPIDFLEGGGGLNAFVPSAYKPLWEAYVAEKSWTGMPLYKDTPWNKDMPEWTKAYKSANKYIVGLANAMNEATGGDPYTKGAIDFNPAKVEYMLNGYFGGVFGTIDKLSKTAETIAGDREYDHRSLLLVNRLVKAGDERTEYRAVNNEYFRLKEEHDRLKSRLKHYEEDTDNGIFDYAEKIDFLYNSPEYERYEIFEDYREDIDDLYNELKEAISDEERKDIEAELNELKKEMIEEMNLTRERK